MNRRKPLTAALLTLLVLGGGNALGKGEIGKLYRWVDAEGNVHYSDRVPQEQASQGHSAFDTEGRLTEEVGKAKSREELIKEAEQQKEMDRLRKEQEKVIAQQKALDDVLLRTFHSEDDLITARNQKVDAIDVQMQVARDNIRLIKKRLEELQADAADAERQGKKAPPKIVDELKTDRERLNAQYTSIVQKEKEKEQIRLTFDKDLERFRSLKNIAHDPQRVDETASPTSLLDNLVSCTDDASCNDLWKKAEAYVRKNATTRLVILSDTVIMTAPPAVKNDVSITVSRLRDKKGNGETLLFLDLQCHSSPGGEELCMSDKVKQIQSGFRPTLTGAPETVPAAAAPAPAATKAAPATPAAQPPAAPAAAPGTKPPLKPKIPKS